jgi:hypothetical protein
MLYVGSLVYIPCFRRIPAWREKGIWEIGIATYIARKNAWRLTAAAGVPPVYLTWANSPFSSFLVFSRINKLRGISGAQNSVSDGEPSKHGLAAIATLRSRLAKLFAEYSVRVTPIIIDIVVKGNSAHEYGWHEFILTPKSRGEPIRKRSQNRDSGKLECNRPRSVERLT